MQQTATGGITPASQRREAAGQGLDWAGWPEEGKKKKGPGRSEANLSLVKPGSRLRVKSENSVR